MGRMSHRNRYSVNIWIVVVILNFNKLIFDRKMFYDFLKRVFTLNCDIEKNY